jgi:hypothetical protein
LAEVGRYLRVNSPIAGRTIITNEAGQVTNSPYIPQEITCALQNFPIVSWYSGDGNFGDADRLYKSKALHNAQHVFAFFTHLDPVGLLLKQTLQASFPDPYVYCVPLSR